MATQTNVLIFTGAEPLDGDTPYQDVSLVTPYASFSVYRTLLGTQVSDGNGPIVATIKDSSKTASGFRVLVSAQFSGRVVCTSIDV